MVHKCLFIYLYFKEKQIQPMEVTQFLHLEKKIEKLIEEYFQNRSNCSGMKLREIKMFRPQSFYLLPKFLYL